MSTPPFKITGSTEGSTAANLKVAEKLLIVEKHFAKIEKIEKYEHKEKPEKYEHKEKPEKVEHKEKPEKVEHKEKPEKNEHKEKIEKIEGLEKTHLEKIPVTEGPGKTLTAEIPATDPGGPIEAGLTGRVGALEQTIGQMQHFITTNLRPDLSHGALKQEPDAPLMN